MGQAPSYKCLNGSNRVIECADGYLIDFYGDSALWYGPVQILFSVFIVVSDIIFMSIFFSSSSLRSIPANFFLVGLVLTDCIHYTCLHAGAIALLIGYVTQTREHTLFCKIVGLTVMATGTCSFGFPGLIAAQRYYKISYMPTLSRFSMGETVFGDKRLVPLMIIWWTISISVNLPLIIFFDEFGEDADGYCGVKPFREALPFAIFLISVISVFVVSYIFMGVYYYRLGRFLKTQHTTESNKESMNITRSIMLMTKIIVIVPMFMMTPTIILTAGQWMLHGLVPMWLNRIIVTLYYIPASMTPWVAIYTLTPFRKQFLKFYFNIKRRLSTEVSTTSVRSVEPN